MEHVWIIEWCDEILGVFTTRQAAKDALRARWEDTQPEPYNEAIMTEDEGETWLLYSGWKPSYNFRIVRYALGWLQQEQLAAA